jgi:HD domain
MSSIYLPTTGSSDWQWLLARPDIHWKYGASAMALADAWEQAGGWPEPVAAALATDPDLSDLELLFAVPEHEVPLPGGSTASQTDLFVLARCPDGDLVTIAVEGKVEERFGDQTVSEWRASESKGRKARLEYLLDVLGLPDDDRLGSIRYQLLHRTASAVIEARRFGARHAVMLVQSFSPTHAWFQDFAAFAALYETNVAEGSVSRACELDEVALHLGWVSDVLIPPNGEAILGPRFDHAFALTRELHADQSRKGTQIPYIAHLMGVASLVLEDGGDEDEAIAALLHDAVEDQGDKKPLRRIRHQFGPRVASIVSACSDTDVVPKPPWRERKEAYIAHLRDTVLPVGTLRVSLADKLHNARAILFDLRAGHDVFDRFNAGRADQHWYYDELATAFTDLTDSPMAAELRRVVDEIRSL